MFHYNHAIRALVADKPPVDIVLPAGVIFWALENFNGNGQAAFDHLKAAIKILGEWKSKRRPNDPTDDLISKYIEPSIIDGIKFASKGRVEELAGQMSTLSLTTRDMRIMNINYPEFENLDNAETYLGDCVRKILTLKSQAQVQTSADEDRAALLADIEQLDAELYKWMHLFQNLTSTGPVYMRRMLIVHNVAAIILLDQLKRQAQYKVEEEEQARDKDEDLAERTGRGRHNFIMREMEDMVRDGPLGTVDMYRREPPNLGFIAPIFLVATSAQKVDTRRRAINALEQLNITEGPWSSMHALRIAEAMLEIARDSAVSPAAVDWPQMGFDYDEEEQCLTMEWASEEVMSSNQTIIKTVDVSGIEWNDSVSAFPTDATSLY